MSCRRSNVNKRKSVVHLSFLSGYTARQLITLIHSLLGDIPIIFYKDWFEIKHANILDEKTGKKIVVNFIPTMRYIIDYETCPEYFAQNQSLVMTPSVRDFTKYVGSASKKDGLEFSCYADQLNSLFVSVIKSGSSGSSNNSFKNVNFKRFQILQREESVEAVPNIKVPLNDICLLCTNINKSRSQYKNIILSGYKYGMSMGVRSHTDVARLSDSWGDCNPDELIGTYYLSLEINKALSGIHNITESGVVPMFFSPGILKFKIPIGCYGETVIILENGSRLDEGPGEGPDPLTRPPFPSNCLGDPPEAEESEEEFEDEYDDASLPGPLLRSHPNQSAGLEQSYWTS